MFKLPSGVTRHLACKTKSNLDFYMSNFRERSQESHQTGFRRKTHRLKKCWLGRGPMSSQEGITSAGFKGKIQPY